MMVPKFKYYQRVEILDKQLCEFYGKNPLIGYILDFSNLDDPIYGPYFEYYVSLAGGNEHRRLKESLLKEISDVTK